MKEIVNRDMLLFSVCHSHSPLMPVPLDQGKKAGRYSYVVCCKSQQETET